MDKIQARIGIKKESKKRVRLLKFGDEITNICAGEGNPIWHCYFVENKTNTVKCTDKKGYFGDYDIEVIYPGHLSREECKELFDPVWQSHYG